jgi:hypothetical protein
VAAVDSGPLTAIWSDCGALRRMAHWLFGSGEEIVLKSGTTWAALVPQGTDEFSIDRASQGLVPGSDE